MVCFFAKDKKLIIFDSTQNANESKEFEIHLV